MSRCFVKPFSGISLVAHDYGGVQPRLFATEANGATAREPTERWSGKEEGTASVSPPLLNPLPHGERRRGHLSGVAVGGELPCGGGIISPGRVSPRQVLSSQRN